MHSESIDFISLLQLQGNVNFIEAAYQTLLQRPVAAFDLLHHLKLLKTGIPREGLLYCICKSEEFDNRFAVPDLNRYRNAYYLFKLKEKLKLINTWKGSCLNSNSPESNVTVLFTFPKITPTALEHQALSLSRIEQLRLAVASAFSQEGGCSSVGQFAEALAPSHCNMQNLEQFTPDSSCKTWPVSDSYFVTSPSIIYELLTGGRLLEFARCVKDRFIFTMPSLPLAAKEITAIWGPQWSDIEVPLFGSCNRWFHGDESHGSLMVYNNSCSYRKIKVRCILLSLEENAEILFKTGTQYKRYSFTFPEIPFEEELYLKPGYNEFPFIYIGHGVIPVSLRAQLLKFAVNRLSIEDLQNGCIFTDENVYSITSPRHGFGYYPYLLSDTFVRSQLHKHGFFQVEATFVSNSYHSEPLDTTRYYYRNDEINHNGYYMYTQGNSPILEQKSGVIVYTAQRKGNLSEHEFSFDHI